MILIVPIRMSRLSVVFGFAVALNWVEFAARFFMEEKDIALNRLDGYF